MMRTLVFAVLAASCFFAPASAAPTAPGRVEFDVLRNGEPFGRHVITVSESGGELTARSEVELRAGLGPVTLYRYEQNCTETWRDGALNGLSCATLKDGRRTRVTASRDGANLNVQGPRGQAFPVGALPTSWWTRPPTDTSAMIDTETGARMPLRVTRIGRETIDVGGARVAADHIRVQGTLAVDLWYDDADRWVGCAFRVGDQNIQYRLTSARASAPA